MVLIITNITIILLSLHTISKLNNKRIKPLITAILTTLTLTATLLFLTNLNFNQIWHQVDHLTKHSLSMSQFHNLEKDKVIAQTILENIIINAALLLFALWAFQKNKKYYLLLFIGLDMLYNTRALLFFAPAQVYPQWNQIISNFQQLEGNRQHDFQHRLLTRNTNEPYSDFGAYWEALTIRPPFAQSYVDQLEINQYNHPTRLRQTLTPIWNSVYGIPIINGYTTLLPTNFAREWHEVGDMGINFINQIQLNNPQLAKWAVNTYWIDNWFDDPVIPPNTPEIDIKKNGELTTAYILPSLSRIRYKDNQVTQISNYHQSPNNQSFQIDNQNQQQFLVIADRYDKNWRATINGNSVNITNYQEMMLLPINPGLNHVSISYNPTLTMLGAIISLLTLVAIFISQKSSALFSHDFRSLIKFTTLSQAK